MLELLKKLKNALDSMQLSMDDFDVLNIHSDWDYISLYGNYSTDLDQVLKENNFEVSVSEFNYLCYKNSTLKIYIHTNNPVK